MKFEIGRIYIEIRKNKPKKMEKLPGYVDMPVLANKITELIDAHNKHLDF